MFELFVLLCGAWQHGTRVLKLDLVSEHQCACAAVVQDFYTYPASMDVGDGQLVAVGEEAPAALTTQGLEMVVNRTEDGSGGQIIGTTKCW